MTSRDPGAAGARALWPRAAEPQALETMRQRVIEALGVHFATDDLTLAELERRLEIAVRADTMDVLAHLVTDLPALPGQYAVPGAPSVLAPGQVPERGVLAAVMGGNVRKGSWLVPRRLKVYALMGGAELDLRQARFAPGVTEIEVLAVMGGVEIIVPPGVRVEMMGFAIMGGFEANGGDAESLDPGRPVLRLSGLAVMGGVEATTRHPKAKALAKFEKALQRVRARDAAGRP